MASFVGNNTNVLGNITIGQNSRVGRGVCCAFRCASELDRCRRAGAHRLPATSERILITDPHEIKDTLSDALIALSERVSQLEAPA